MEIDLPISETLFWISAVVLGTTTYHFLENGESYSKLKFILLILLQFN